MDRSESRFLESCRIILAKEFEIPPDNIDIIPIIDCSKRAIIDNCGRSDENGPILDPLTDREKSAIFSEHGPIIIHKIFSKEAPFYEWVEKFEENYIRTFLENINRKEKF